jgi:uncharacterized membrane protein SpoIIM required for sporulation
MTPSFTLFMSLFTLSLVGVLAVQVYGPRVAERVRRQVKVVRVTWRQARTEDKFLFSLFAGLLVVYFAWAAWRVVLL